MEITLKLEIGLAPKCEEFLTRLFSRIPETEQPQPEPETEPEPEQEQETEPETETQPKAVPEQEMPPTDEEMRTMMDITISKLTGSNEWKNATDPVNLAIRQGCTRTFKEIARHLGAEKPTALQGEARLKFIYALDEIMVNREKGEVTWTPF